MSNFNKFFINNSLLQPIFNSKLFIVLLIILLFSYVGSSTEIPDGTKFVNKPDVSKIINKYEDKNNFILFLEILSILLTFFHCCYYNGNPNAIHALLALICFFYKFCIIIIYDRLNISYIFFKY